MSDPAGIRRQYYEKHRAAARAPRPGVYGGSAPDCARRGGCGRHAPPQDVHKLRAFDPGGMVANLARLRARGNTLHAGAQAPGGSREKTRAQPATALPEERGGYGAPGSTPGAGARQGQRGRRTRTAGAAERTPTRPKRDHGKAEHRHQTN